ncbi:protein CHLOROPLAST VESICULATION [Malania oleifera]|uniref:protein CHLOROPLAST VESICULATION n=1 Tax=Malania oleifera TaxID=397392 RepID=UPI0025ADD6ED|nr:protein CHLOROPLAST VESICULATION [Malania oleifera]
MGMLITSCCCRMMINQPPPTPSKSSSALIPMSTQVSCWKNNTNEKLKRGRSRESELGMACACIVLIMEISSGGESRGLNLGIAMMNIGSDLQWQGAGVGALTAALDEYSSSNEAKAAGKLRWSDKRMCPPWRLNSLETIVPENLPRPSFRRRWQAVGTSSYPHHHQMMMIAPDVFSESLNTVSNANSCFSM